MSSKNILVIGVKSSGKTTLLDNFEAFLKFDKKITVDSSDVPFRFTFPRKPTDGIETKTITVGKQSLIFREIGGSLCNMWANFLKSSDIVMFVIDSSDYSTLAACTCELIELVGHPDAERLKFLIVLNKIDLPSSMLLEEVQVVMRFDTLPKEKKDRIMFCETSAIHGDNFDSIAKWLLEQCI